MKRRMIDGGVWANEKFAEMPCMARLLQIGLINLADDQGRVKAHPAYLRSQLFPYDDVTLEQVASWLQIIVTNGTAIVYEADGKEYLQLLNWWEYQNLQYASPSEYPRPDGWHDRIRYNAKGHVILTCNWMTVSGEQLEDLCDEDGNPLPIVATLPPKNPGGRPPKNPGGNPPGNIGENPGGNINNDQIKINTDQAAAATRTRARIPEAAPAATAATDPDVAQVWEAWHANMPGTRTPIIVDGVNSLLDDYTAAEIVEAIAIACKRNKRTLSYVQGILAKGALTKPPPTPSGGDYPPTRSPNRGRAAATAYMERKGMLNGRN